MKRSLAFLALSLAFLCPSRGEEIFTGKTPVTAGGINLTTDRFVFLDADTDLLGNITPHVLLTDAAGTYFLSPAAVAAAYQGLDSDLTLWAGYTPSANGGALVSAANYAAMRGLLDLEPGTDFLSVAAIAAAYQPLDSDLTSLAALTTTAAGRAVLTYADPNADRILFWDDSAGAFTNLTVGSGLDIAGTTLTATGGGTGDVTAAANFGTDNRLIRSDGTTKGVQSSGITVSDADAVSGIASIAVTGGLTAGSLEFEGATADASETSIAVTDPTSDRTITLPDATGTVALAQIVTKSTAANYTIGTTDSRELYGGTIYVTGAATLTIPAVAAGASFTVITVGAVAVSVDPNASDLVVLDGTALSDGDKVTNTSTAGDIAVFTYYDGTGWYCASNSWTDGN